MDSNTSQPDIVLVDGNNIGYAAMYVPAFARLAHNGFPTGAIHGAIASIFARMKARPKAVPVVFWDRSASWRHELMPEYKASRSATPEKLEIRMRYKQQLPITQQLLSAMGIPQVSCGESEADDLVGHACRELDESWQVECLSKDTDWWQALKSNVTWFPTDYDSPVRLQDLQNPEHRVTKNSGHFLSTDEYLECKALAGDDSDEIAGLDGVGLKTAAKIIRKHGSSIEHFWAKVDAGDLKPKGKTEEMIASTEARTIFRRNHRMMDWRQAPEIRRDLLAITCGAPHWALIEDLTQHFGLSKAARDAKTLLEPWEDGWGDGFEAVYRALHSDLCQPLVKRA